MPLVVLAGGRSGPAPQGLSEEVWRALNDEKRTQKADLATLSTRGRLVVVEQSGHHVQLDAPGRVIEAVAEVIALVRGGR